MKFIYELHKIMQTQDLILIYEGEFTQDITKAVLSMAERNMDSSGEESSVKRKVFNVMVECLQNISKHAESFDEKSKAKNNAIFMIGKQEKEYFITSGNIVRKDSVDSLKNKLDKINSLDKSGLKELYKEIIKAGKLSEKGGAGLGLVDMARKSGNKLKFDFEPVNQKFSFFSLQTTIHRS